jgi:hypothetical protein
MHKDLQRKSGYLSVLPGVFAAAIKDENDTGTVPDTQPVILDGKDLNDCPGLGDTDLIGFQRRCSTDVHFGKKRVLLCFLVRSLYLCRYFDLRFNGRILLKF